MLVFLKDFPENVMAFQASGTVTQSDYQELMIPAIEAGFARDDKLRIYFETTPDFQGFTAGAVMEDVGLSLASLFGWEKAVIVTDVDWLHQAVEVMKFLSPCPTKVFHLAESQTARDWIAA